MAIDETGKVFITQVKLPGDETAYLIKDADARTEINSIEQRISGGMHYLGITSTELEDGDTTATIAIGGNNKTMASTDAGDMVIYGDKEFIWNGTAWQLFGSPSLDDLTGVGDLAYADTASGTVTITGDITATTSIPSGKSANYTPAGSITVGGLTGTSYTPAGSVTITDPGVSETADYTPEGAVTFADPDSGEVATYTPEGAITSTTTIPAGKSANYTPQGSVSGVTAGQNDTANYTPAGNIAVADAAVGDSGNVIKALGTVVAPSWTAEVTNGELAFTWSAGSVSGDDKAVTFNGAGAVFTFAGTDAYLGFVGNGKMVGFEGVGKMVGFSGEATKLDFTGTDTYFGLDNMTGSVTVTPDPETTP